MKTLIKLSLIAITVSMLSSCAIHSGNMNGSATLTEANFTYIEQSARGSAQTVKIFGIGGLGDDALVEKAKKDMLSERELQSNQAAANVTVDWRHSWMFFVRTTKCTVSADIVEFRNPNISYDLLTQD